jgi:SRSO17 transposase
LIEWPDGEKEPIKYWLSTCPEDVAFRQLVDIAKLRWRIEREVAARTWLEMGVAQSR